MVIRLRRRFHRYREVYREAARVRPLRAELACGNAVLAGLSGPGGPARSHSYDVADGADSGANWNIRRAWIAILRIHGCGERGLYHVGGLQLFRVGHHRGERRDDAGVVADDGPQ